MQEHDTTGNDDTPALPDWISGDDLIAAGCDERLVAALPATHRGHDSRPVWHHEELPALIDQVRGVRA